MKIRAYSMRRVRHGLSLLEVLVALTIFLLAFVALGQLIVMGTDRAQDVQQQTRAVQLCQTKMAEVVAGAVKLSPQVDVAFDEAPAWRWSLDCAQSNLPGLWNVTVRVKEQHDLNSHFEYALRQMLLDPKLRGSVQDTASDCTSISLPPSTTSESSNTPGKSGP